MVTRNLKHACAMLLLAGSPGMGTLPIADVNGQVLYHNGTFSMFPCSITYSGTLNAASNGISVGRDGTPATELDYNLGDTITSGVSISVSSSTRTAGRDGGDPWIRYVVTVTNTGSEAVTVREIGMKQSLYGSTMPGGTGGSYYPCLLDRTVLPSPITIAPGDAGVIHYKLKVDATPVKTVHGVEMVSWCYGEAAKVSAMLTAAQQGIIDLHSDGGWCVGDVRYVDIGAFSTTDVNFTAQTAAIAIGSFADYEGCGSILQLDFRTCLAQTARMNPTSTTVGGYGASEMYTTTLPAMEAALPDWLRGHLKTFSVKASAGSSSDDIVTVTGNKLALRSEVEVFGSTQYAKPGEGALVELYRNRSFREKANANYWWLRSPPNSKFVCVQNSGPYAYNNYGASSHLGLAPFMCI